MVVSWQKTGMDVSWHLHRALIHEFFQTVPMIEVVHIGDD